jgi:putative transposase
MPRCVRIQWPGAYYHVIARGNRRQPIFLDDNDRRFFLAALSEACGRTGWRIHAWVLMSNHYHLCIHTPEPNLVDGMKWLQNTFTRRFNTRHRLWGRLFGDRYKAVPIEQGSGDYYQSLIDYLHLNPVRARIIPPRGDLLTYPWSSLPSGFTILPRRRPPWLAVTQALANFNLPDTAAGRRRYLQHLQHLQHRAAAEPRTTCGTSPPSEDARRSSLSRGWYWGRQAFEEKLQRLLQLHPRARSNRNYRTSSQQKHHGLRHAEALLARGLAEHRLTPSQLPSLPGTDPRKIQIALRIWQASSVSQSWIATRLSMKSAANVSQILHRAKPRHAVKI